MAQEPGFKNVSANLAWRWDNMRVTRQAGAIQATAKRLYARKKEFYDPVAAKVGCPWWMIAVIDERESGATGGVLHNGEKIIGTGRKTRLVPAGRGPFSTWYNAAVDALTMPGKNFDKVPRDKWTVELVLYCLEAYNGWGYRQYHPKTPSPYIWSCTNIYDNSPRGKYVADGQWGAGVTDQQIGCAPLLKALLELNGEQPKRLYQPGEVTAVAPLPDQELPATKDPSKTSGQSDQNPSTTPSTQKSKGLILQLLRKLLGV